MVLPGQDTLLLLLLESGAERKHKGYPDGCCMAKTVYLSWGPS